MLSNLPGLLNVVLSTVIVLTLFFIVVVSRDINR